MKSETFAISFASLLVLAGCRDSPTSQSSTTTTTTTTAPTPAQVTAVVSDVDIGMLQVRFSLTLRESAGTAVNINFIRFETRWVDGVSEQYEIGSTSIAAVLGSNILEANGMESVGLTFPISARGREIESFVLTIGMTDVYGNDKTIVHNF